MKNYSQEQLATAFSEWERRYREEPDRFQSEMQRLALSTDDYGAVSAAYLLAILAEQEQ